MTAMMIAGGKRVAAGGARLEWHMIPIADIDLIARNTRGEENGVASKTFSFAVVIRSAFARGYGATGETLNRYVGGERKRDPTMDLRCIENS